MKYDSAKDKWNVIWGHRVLNDAKLEQTLDATAIPDAKENTDVS